MVIRYAKTFRGVARHAVTALFTVMFFVSYAVAGSSEYYEDVVPTVTPELSDMLWKIFEWTWPVSLVGIAIILINARRRRKVRVSTAAPDEVVEGLAVFKPVEYRWLIVLLLHAVVSFFVFFYAAYFLNLAVIGGSMILFLYFSPHTIQDVGASIRHYRDRARQKTNRVAQSAITFQEVGGLTEVKAELQNTISLLKNPKLAKEWGMHPSKGILLIGPPGCGKTHLARAVAGECGLPFIEESAAKIGNQYVRSGAQDIHTLFQKVDDYGRAVVFIDEIDALGRRRGSDPSGEFDHAVNQFLSELDGFVKRDGVLLIAATNREDVLDDALLRPGRFGKKILIPPPDVKEREEILAVHTAKKPLASDVALRDIAVDSVGFSGAALEELCNEAAQIAWRRSVDLRQNEGIFDRMKGLIGGAEKDSKVITKSDFREASLKVTVGLERKMVMGAEERKEIAQHEMGHAMVALEFGLGVLKQVTIMPRNWALGLTGVGQKEERFNQPRRALVAQVATLMGGRAAEEVFLTAEGVTTGAVNDFEKADEIVRKMICEWGMGKNGPSVFYKFGGQYSFSRPYSEQAAAEIDAEVKLLRAKCYEEAKAVITKHKDLIQHLVGILLEKTVLQAEEIQSIIRDWETKQTAAVPHP